MNIKLLSLIVGAISGVVVCQIAVYFLGYTAAITLPASIADWAADRSASFLVFFVWDLFVVQFLGIGLLAAVVSYVLLTFSRFKWFYLATGFVVAETIFAYSWLLSSLLDDQALKNNYLLFMPHFIVVCLCVFVAAGLGGKKQRV